MSALLPFSFALGRPLSPADVHLALTAPTEPNTPRSGAVRKLHATHHNIAILVSRGMGDVDVSRITGYSPNDIALLRLDPMFKELVARYANVARTEEPDIAGQLSAITQAAIAELGHRLATQPEKLSARDLESIARFGADRTGFGPSSTVVNATESVTQVIEALKSRYLNRQGGRVMAPAEVAEQEKSAA